MWRTSWLSREVIVLPAFIGVVFGWLVTRSAGRRRLGLHAGDGRCSCVIVGAALLVCTAMIYACLRFIQEWAHPLTVVNYVLIGLCFGVGAAPRLAVARRSRTSRRLLAAWAAVSRSPRSSRDGEPRPQRAPEAALDAAVRDRHPPAIVCRRRWA